MRACSAPRSRTGEAPAGRRTPRPPEGRAERKVRGALVALLASACSAIPAPRAQERALSPAPRPPALRVLPAAASTPRLDAMTRVFPDSRALPGTTLTYTVVVTNVGFGEARGVVMTGRVPAHTTFVPGSITCDGSGRTDEADGDNANFDGTGAGAITVWVGTMAHGAAVTVAFRVTID